MVPIAGFCMSKYNHFLNIKNNELLLFLLAIKEFNRVVAEWSKLQATHPTATLADLIVTLQNNGLPSLSG